MAGRRNGWRAGVGSGAHDPLEVRDKAWTDCLGFQPGMPMEQVKAKIIANGERRREALVRERDEAREAQHILANGHDDLEAQLQQAQARVEALERERDAMKADYDTLKAFLEQPHNYLKARVEALERERDAKLEAAIEGWRALVSGYRQRAAEAEEVLGWAGGTAAGLVAAAHNATAEREKLRSALARIGSGTCETATDNGRNNLKPQLCLDAGIPLDQACPRCYANAALEGKPVHVPRKAGSDDCGPLCTHPGSRP